MVRLAEPEVSVGRDPVAAYRLVLAAGAVALFVTNAWLFLYLRKLISLPPLYPALAFIGLGLPLLLHPRTLAVLARLPLLIWGAVYAVGTIASFFWSSQSDVALQAVQTRMLWLLLLFAHIIVLADPAIHRAVRMLLIVAVVVGVGLNVWDLFHPSTFSLIIGRAAGLYGNPNIAASALILGMIVGLDAVPARWRGWFVLLVGIGVLITLSRGGVLGWCLVAGVLLWQRAVAPGQLLLAGALAAVAGGLAVRLAGGWVELRDRVQFDQRASEVWNRVTQAGLYIQSGDPSTEYRVLVLREGLALAEAHPVVGAGVGATLEWSRSESTHNIYILHMAELGVAGTLIYPLFLVALLWGIRGVARPRAVALVAFLAFWGLVSHNGLDEWAGLVPIGLLAVEGALSRNPSA
jgi:O-antigen ligase